MTKLWCHSDVYVSSRLDWDGYRLWAMVNWKTYIFQCHIFAYHVKRDIYHKNNNVNDFIFQESSRYIIYSYALNNSSLDMEKWKDRSSLESVHQKKCQKMINIWHQNSLCGTNGTIMFLVYMVNGGLFNDIVKHWVCSKNTSIK